MKDRVFVFDVDGTLTPARQRIDDEFESWFYDFCQNNDVYLVSGSDRNKTLEQISTRIYDSCLGVYQCSGNELWEKNRRAKTNGWKPTFHLKQFLENFLAKSRCPVKTSTHVEVRTGMINFSTIGRDCTLEQRQQYFEWDKVHKEREVLAKAIQQKFKELNATIGGEISVDIYPKGADKSQVARDLREEYKEILFFGDKIDYGGNDFSIATAIELEKLGTATQVRNWEHTWELLKEYTQ